jgi:hypothetical protein
MNGSEPRNSSNLIRTTGRAPLIRFGVVSSLLIVGGAVVALLQLDRGMIGLLFPVMLVLGAVWCILIGWFPRSANLWTALSFLALDTLLMVAAAWLVDERTGPHIEDWTGFAIIYFVPVIYGSVAVGLVTVYGVSYVTRRNLTRRRSIAAIDEEGDRSTR